MILSGADNRPPMLDKDLDDSWKIRMELYMQNRDHRRMILESVENGQLIWPTVEENGVTRIKNYAELSAAEKIQADCDTKATNFILQGLSANIYSLVNHYRVAKDLWERVQLLMQGFAVHVFSLRDDLIAFLNKAMAFLIAVASSMFPLTNNQLRTSSNPRNQATIQDGRVIVKQLQSYSGTGYKSNATSSGETMQVDKQGLLNAKTIKSEDLDTYDSDYDDILNAKAVLMANISNYGLDVISKEHDYESVTAELERYKERVKTFEQRLNVDLRSLEKMIDSQMDDMIKEKLELKEQVDSLE
nr:hypothetical protein [Tanacetum cinerariifolium]